ncbi:hypothetical protein AXG93_673s1390 [Marchantia polymorpha subsp. ruderalis]|uniref:Gfo/Idh/MocA-like oxidoreductase N-terminal domain-containing protein n=1 Tax=Marchantia polymorpha subsp. ruderalis TaxID=1480154 RepID=A0A176WKX9_MARPO|nr:hypothetical protein AXG93_673s1390 [Marchantia polymorpha subsp. ruderalis]
MVRGEEAREVNGDSLKVVRYGIVGCGMMGQEHMMNLFHLAGAQVVAIADTSRVSLTQACALSTRSGHSRNLEIFRNHGDLLDSGLCDVVIISTPNMTHAQIIMDVLAHPGRHHILVEKPLCTHVADCKKVMEAAKRRPDILVQVGLEYRYMPPVAKLLKHVKASTFGRVRMISIKEHRFPFLVKASDFYCLVDDWNRFNENTGGTLVEKCCHFFDLMNLMADSRPRRVMASGAQDVNHLDERYNGKVPDIIDNAYVIVEYENGIRAMLDLCMFAEGSKNEQEISVVGDLAKVEALVPENVMRLGSRSGSREGVETFHCHDDRIKYSGLHHGSSYLEHLDFIDAVRSHGRKPPVVGLYEGLLSVAIGQAAQLSIKLRRFVNLDEVMQEKVSEEVVAF